MEVIAQNLRDFAQKMLLEKREFMLSIAVCDDEHIQLEKMVEVLTAYLQARPSLKGQVATFSCGQALLEESRARGGFDLYVLDILMPELDGIQTGRKLRQLGSGGEIIFLTSSNDFAADSYDVRAFFYLLKPVEERKLFQVLDGAVEKLSRRRSSAVVVSTSDGSRRILLEQIRYAERSGRAVRYHCTSGTVDSQSIRVPFREAVASLLSDRRFFLCGASYVLNFQHVTGVKGQEALLDDGSSVPLPRAAAADFKKAWGGYWLEENLQ